MRLQDAPDDKLISAFVKIRDARAQRKAAYTNEDSADKEKQEKIESEFLRRFHERGVTSVSARGLGNAHMKIATSATVADRGVYLDWILADPEERISFLDVKANKTSVLQYRDANDDLPPGINWSETQVVEFRRA